MAVGARFVRWAGRRRAAGLGVVLVAGLVSVLAPSARAGSTFVDVSPAHTFHLEITWAADQGIVEGYPDGTFRPSASVTRQAMAAFLHRFAGSPPSAPTSPTFSDVSLSHPFSAEVEWLAASGIASGYADGTFRPGVAVSRQAMASYLYRFAGAPPPPDDLAAVYSDVTRSHAFFVPIAFLFDFGIADGFSDGTFRPLEPVSRQATSALLYRLDALLSDPEATAGSGSADAGAGADVTPGERADALPPWVPRG